MYSESTLQFLMDLKVNNNKEWFENHRSSYELARKEHLKITDALLNEIAAFDESVVGLKGKDCIFRINRDIRFSKDKTPYKTNFGTYFSNKKDINKGGYYFNLELGNSFMGGGVYHPERDYLNKIRQEIDYNFDEFKNILAQKDFIKWYGGTLKGEALKRPPKDYLPENPAIEYLKHKDFVASFHVPDQKLLQTNFIEQSVKAFKALKPLMDFFNRVWD